MRGLTLKFLFNFHFSDFYNCLFDIGIEIGKLECYNQKRTNKGDWANGQYDNLEPAAI